VEGNEILSMPIQDHEIKDAFFQMDMFKVPSPNNFGQPFSKTIGK